MSSGPPAKSVPMESTWLPSHSLAYLTFLCQLEISSRPLCFIPFENAYCKMHTLFIVCALSSDMGPKRFASHAHSSNLKTRIVFSPR